MPDRIDTGSLDIATRRRAELKALFPAAFTETRDEHGALRESVDFEKLKAELGTFSDVFENRRERYGMDWPGKKDCLKVIQQPSHATLRPCRKESVEFDTTENLFIEGDNLEVLKLLQKSYYGKVKMIYIDPPYNTGNEFIYPDNYSESLGTYLAYAGLIDSEGKRFATNTQNEGRFHTKWLNMMYPRLYLARNLLRDDGVIFISIDDNEFVGLRHLCNEVFGEENFVSTLVWNSSTGGGIRSKHVNQNHEFVVCYARDKVSCPMFHAPLSEEAIDQYDKQDDQGRYREKDFAWRTLATNGNQRYGIKAPDNTLLFPKSGYSYRFIETTFEEARRAGLVVFKPTKNGPLVDEGGRPAKYNIYIKKYLGDGKGAPTSLLPKSIVGISNIGTEELKSILGNPVFNNPKSSRLLSYILAMGSDEDSIVLDFFSGSGTTAHTVLDLNRQDKGNRKFICVQLPEPCDEDSEAFKAGFKTIADIGKERIRRVIKKLDEEDASKSVAERTGRQDRGFRTLKLDRSNFRQWPELSSDTPPEKIAQQLQLHVDHVSSEAIPEDVLFEVLIKAGILPASKISKTEIAGLPVYSVEDGRILVCLADAVTPSLIEAVSQAAPEQFLCLDRAFHGNDQLRANASQAFETRNDTRRDARPIAFRTI